MQHELVIGNRWKLLWVGAAVLTGLFLWLVWLDRGDHGYLDFDSEPLPTALFALVMLVFPTLAIPVIKRQPRNPIGWLFYGAGVTLALGSSAQAYADLAIYKVGLSGGMMAAWVASWLASMGLIATPIFLMFLFPTGQPLSPGWRRIFVALAIAAALTYLGLMFRPGVLDGSPGLENPFGAEGAMAGPMRWLADLNNQLVAPAAALGVVAVIARFRRARGIERLQLKWFVYIGTIVLVSFLGASIAGQTALSDLFFVFGVVAFLALPFVVVLAMLRYRLYEIDQLISRTLSYGLVTVSLVAVYGLGVLLLQQVTPFQGDLAVAGSTLAAAALFNPLRRRVQEIVNRRFNRNRYDNQRMIESFGQHLQTSADLSNIEMELIGITSLTVAPTHLAVWIKSRR